MERTQSPVMLVSTSPMAWYIFRALLDENIEAYYGRHGRARDWLLSYPYLGSCFVSSNIPESTLIRANQIAQLIEGFID